MNTFLRSDEFDTWLSGLKDRVGRARIVHRSRSAEQGNFSVIVRLLAMESPKCASMPGLATERISPGAQR